MGLHKFFFPLESTGCESSVNLFRSSQAISRKRVGSSFRDLPNAASIAFTQRRLSYLARRALLALFPRRYLHETKQAILLPREIICLWATCSRSWRDHLALPAVLLIEKRSLRGGVTRLKMRQCVFIQHIACNSGAHCFSV